MFLKIFELGKYDSFVIRMKFGIFGEENVKCFVR